ncbi:hypothetical protein LXL04_029885 [Taraxacum kok-saghyz]
MEGLDDAGDGSMLCNEHPFKSNTPAGGICAFCLQEKLGKLVSSSFPIAVFPSSSSSSPSFRSDIGGGGGGGGGATGVPPRVTNPSSLMASNTQNQITPSNASNECHYHQYYSNRSRILYLLSQKKKKKKDLNIIVDGGGGGHGHDRSKNVVFKRSKSTATPRRGGGLHFMDTDNVDGLNTPHRRGFWSFLYLQKQSHSSSSTRKTLRNVSSNGMGTSAAVGSFSQRSRQDNDTIVVEENESPCHASFDRKVSRSRSVGCGSRSFSGDFFERISTGFGDCTLRRVESQREGKSKVSGMRGNGGHQDCIKERVRCGGLFSGFMITSSSSSSSSSSYWVASNPNEGTAVGNAAGKMTSAAGTGAVQNQQHSHGRSKSWGWALASPMRAFSKPSSTKREASHKNQTPNLAAIPSLLSLQTKSSKRRTELFIFLRVFVKNYKLQAPKSSPPNTPLNKIKRWAAAMQKGRHTWSTNKLLKCDELLGIKII